MTDYPRGPENGATDPSMWEPETGPRYPTSARPQAGFASGAERAAGSGAEGQSSRPTDGDLPHATVPSTRPAFPLWGGDGPDLAGSGETQVTAEAQARDGTITAPDATVLPSQSAAGSALRPVDSQQPPEPGPVAIPLPTAPDLQAKLFALVSELRRRQPTESQWLDHPELRRLRADVDHLTVIVEMCAEVALWAAEKAEEAR